MNNFSDRIFLLLTLKQKEFNKHVFSTLSIILYVAIWNCISLVTDTPKAVSWWALGISAVIIIAVYAYLNSQRIKINYKFLERVDEVIAESPQEEVEPEPIVEPEQVTAPSDNEIKLVEEVEDTSYYTFEDDLNHLFKTAQPSVLAELGARGNASKVHRMNRSELKVPIR